MCQIGNRSADDGPHGAQGTAPAEAARRGRPGMPENHFEIAADPHTYDEAGQDAQKAMLGKKPRAEIEMQQRDGHGAKTAHPI